ncbi:hypothetical protein HP548_22820 [Paenibacillus taichungensis]|uniref:Uncharacterized protein n=1 Tax=Paenibacillus taichungensis TaxID=484184 RepID=A0ABX2MS87_9BACL|nr:hypothetical protein [Paenibacillus taichungensis]NUU56919.1 hypothetical protein [Paenibacillus taichungensis]
MSNIKHKEQSSNKELTGALTNKTNIFNEKKNRLKAFSKSFPNSKSLPSVPTSKGLFGLFDYKVTGSDLNSLTEKIQDKMIKQNQILVKTIQEFNTIYDTFSALDKEYIRGILISLKSAEEANAKALKGINGVKENQIEITQIIEQQKQVIQVLKKFKEKIEKIEHLTDVDTIFGELSTMQSNLKVNETKIETQDLRLVDLNDEMKSLLSSLSVFQGNFNYFKEIQVEKFQTVKQLVSNQNENISEIELIITDNKTNIAALNKEIVIHGEKLGDLKQLIQNDIQILSEKVTRNNSELVARLVSTTNEVSTNKLNFENAIKELNTGIDQKAESMSAYLKSELSKAKNEIAELSLFTKSLSKVLKITQAISFTSIAILCILVLLIISGVL